MNVNDLRAALHERADTVTDHDAERRVGQVRARVRVARRRRIAGAAALTVVALAAVSAVVAFPDTVAGPELTRPAEPTEPSVVAPPLPVIEHEGFLSHSGEFDLVAATIGEPGENTLDLTIPAHSGEVHVAMVCYGVSGPAGVYWVSGYGGDRPDRPDSQWCGGDPDAPAVPGVSGSAPGPWSYDNGLRFGPSNDPLTVHLELTQELDEDGVPLDRPDEIGTYVPVSHPEAVLGMGVYQVAEPVTTVAGTAIRPLVGLDGKDYAYRDHRSSTPGERSLTWTLEPSTVERYYDFVAADAVDPDEPRSSVEALLDGDFCRYNVGGDATFREGGCLLSPGVPHTITVTLQGTPQPDAVLGIVLYERTG